MSSGCRSSASAAAAGSPACRAPRGSHARCPDANVLFLTIDLCSLCLRIDDPSIEMFVSAALFGDGAVGVVLRGEPKGEAGVSARPARIVATGEHLWRGTERIMGWDMKHDGFGVVLSPRTALPDAGSSGRSAGRLSRQARARGSGISTASCSIPADARCWRLPGTCSVSARTTSGIPGACCATTATCLRPPCLFVLDEAIRKGAKGRHLLAAFGPGFSAYFAILEL